MICDFTFVDDLVICCTAVRILLRMDFFHRTFHFFLTEHLFFFDVLNLDDTSTTLLLKFRNENVFSGPRNEGDEFSCSSGRKRIEVSTASIMVSERMEVT